MRFTVIIIVPLYEMIKVRYLYISKEDIFSKIKSRDGRWPKNTFDPQPTQLWPWYFLTWRAKNWKFGIFRGKFSKPKLKMATLTQPEQQKFDLTWPDPHSKIFDPDPSLIKAQVPCHYFFRYGKDLRLHIESHIFTNINQQNTKVCSSKIQGKEPSSFSSIWQVPIF